jgi:hypothetical protein
MCLFLSVAAVAQTTIFNFEGDAPAVIDFNGSTTTFVDNPDVAEPNISATVAQNTIVAGSAFGGVKFIKPVDLANGKIFTMLVWSPIENLPVLLKFEGGTGPDIERGDTFIGPANSWQELTFDFNDEADASFAEIVVFMNFNVVDTEDRTFFWDDLIQGGGGGGGTDAPSPQTAAPTPVDAASEVVSVFSDAYDDVMIDTYRTPWSVGDLVDTMIEGNATLKYENLDFVGIEATTNPIDLTAAGVSAMHIDYWSANGTFFGVKLVDFGADGVFGGEDDVEHQIDVTSGLVQGEWIGLDFALDDFTGLTTRSNIAQIILVGQPSGANDVYIDNIYFFAGVPSVRQMDLPVTFEEGDVDYGLADFAGASSMLVLDPDDEMNIVAQTTKNAGAETFAGTTLTSISGGFEGFANPVPLAEGASTMSVRVWSPTSGTPVRLKVENVNDPGISVEAEVVTTVAAAWDTLVFDFSNQAPGTAAVDYTAVYDKATIFFDFGTVPAADATYFWDNVEFGGTVIMEEVGPMTAAPTPTVDAADVISLFSDAYDDVTVDTYLAGFSVGTLTDTLLEGNATLLYRDLNFAGIETIGDNAIDLEAAGMTHLHLDFWSANSTTFRTKLVDFGGDGFGGANADTEFEIPNDLPQGRWVSVDYPLTDFAGMNQSDINQLIISSAPAGASTVYIDNIYFYRGEVLGAQMDLPVTFDEENVDYGLAGFGGVNSEVVADPTDATNMVARSTKTAGAQTWGGTTLTSISGGPDGFASRIPFSADANIITVRVWSPTAGTPFLLKAEQTDDPNVSVETFASTTVAEAWETLTFDFTNEAPGTAAINYDAVYGKLSFFPNFGTSPTADEVYFWDDIIFGDGGGTGGGDDEPMTAAPTPTRAAENVISLFSDAYTDVPVDTWRTDWSMADLTDIEIEGNATRKYTNLNFVGVETIANPINLTEAGMTHLHINYWTPNMDTVRVKLVDFGMDGFGGDNDTEAEPVFMTTKNEWVTLEIPLEDFAGMNQTDISQLIFSGLPAGAGTLYIDNVYFFKDIMDGTDTPVVGLLEAFPNPVNEAVNITAPVRMNELTLYNFSGQVVGNWAPNAERFDVEMGHLPAGYYVALVNTDEGSMTIKLVKQ